MRKQFLILRTTSLLAFVAKNSKFADCTDFTDITNSVRCKEVAGLSSVSLTATTAAAAEDTTTDLAQKSWPGGLQGCVLS